MVPCEALGKGLVEFAVAARGELAGLIPHRELGPVECTGFAGSDPGGLFTKLGFPYERFPLLKHCADVTRATLCSHTG